jgi:uncharacterized protein (DUF433 family)
MVKKVEDIWAKHINISPVIAGGRPHIVGHRITVHNVVIWHRQLGMSVTEIASAYGLRLVDVNAALGYYHDHINEVEQFIIEDEAFVQDLRSRTRSKLDRYV